MTEEQLTEARALIEPLTGYTPGPWERDAQGVYTAGGFRCVLSAYSHERGFDWPTTVANADLAAAAPTMRDTIAALLAHIDAQAQREAEKDARIAELEGAMNAHENMTTVRAIEIVMSRLKMDRETQRIMRVQLHNARTAVDAEVLRP